VPSLDKGLRAGPGVEAPARRPRLAAAGVGVAIRQPNLVVQRLIVDSLWMTCGRLRAAFFRRS